MNENNNLKLNKINWKFNNPHRSILMHHFKYLKLENLSDLLDFVLKGNLDKPFKRPSLYSGKEGCVKEFNFGKKQKSEIIKCLNYFFPEKQINLNDESIWYKSENLINY
jgi:hypothetical protein